MIQEPPPYRAEPLDAVHLEARLAGLRTALDTCPAEVPASLALPARQALDEVGERLALGVDHTVVALFGGTGSGKSSLFNALTQLQFADVGARRPTTSQAAACSWGDDASALLDFLGVNGERRIRRESLLDASDQDELAGLVLLDVPDYDSVTTAHALQVDRLVPLADILVWVVDPQKYADAALHEGYLRGLGARQEDMLVLVNQIDTLPAGGAATLLKDVRDLLVADGLRYVHVLPVSAVRGDNLGEIRRILCDRVAQESNAARTAAAELDAITTRLRTTVAPRPVTQDPAFAQDAEVSLIRASGAQAVADSVRKGLARVMPRALARPEPPSKTAVAAARTTWLGRVTEGLPSVWLRSVESAVSTPEALAAQTAEAVGSVPLPGHRAPIIEMAWWAGVLAGLVALIWGGVAVGAGGSVLPPAALLLIGMLVAGAAMVLRRSRARKEAELYASQVRARVGSVVSRGLVVPADEVLARHRELQKALRVGEELGNGSGGSR